MDSIYSSILTKVKIQDMVNLVIVLFTFFVKNYSSPNARIKVRQCLEVSLFVFWYRTHNITTYLK